MLSTLLILMAHGLAYRFLTDDAFISFRYARNLAEGNGLVFNPGGERVEGYTNFLWVVILAVLSRLGLPPEIASQILGFLLTGALWGLVAVYTLRDPPNEPHRWLVVVPLLFLAVTRSVAVWTTGGLETRLYETLILGGVLSLMAGLETPGPGGRWPTVAGILFALAALTRPDGLLIGACCFIVAGSILMRRGRGAWRLLVAPGAAFALPVASHYLFRRAYYGDWLPNTYYAKVGGTTWWSMGASYLAMFAIEYAACLWLPLLLGAVIHHWRRGTGYRVVLILAVIIPHAIFVASVGGDHFEYRPLDLYFPLFFLLLYDGAKRLSRGALGSWVVSGYLAVVLAGLIGVPWLSHAQFPADAYRGGFPGTASDGEDPSSRYLVLDRQWPYNMPGLRWIGRAYTTLLRRTTASFVGLRAEEHAAFLATVVPEGVALGSLVEEGILPPDTHIAIDCVGAIPYYSGLNVLDRLGLTDRQVARSPAWDPVFLVHSKRARMDYARRVGVDFWALDYVHLRWTPEDPAFISLVSLASREKTDAYLVDPGDGSHILAYLPQGIDQTRRRFPQLKFRSLREPDAAAAPAHSDR